MGTINCRGVAGCPRRGGSERPPEAGCSGRTLLGLKSSRRFWHTVAFYWCYNVLTLVIYTATRCGYLLGETSPFSFNQQLIPT